MRVLPVLDLLGGVVVRGIGGRRHEYQPVQSQLVSSSDPLAVATAFRDRLGLSTLYVADLDGIQRAAPHFTVFQLLAAENFRLLIDAGIRSIQDAAMVLESGAEAVVVGLETCSEPSLLAALVREFGPERIVFSLDLKAGQPLVSNSEWQNCSAIQIANEAIGCGVTQLIVLDLASVGEECGPSTVNLCLAVRDIAPHIRLITGGGIRSREDLRTLQASGIDDVLLSTSLHNKSIQRADIEWL